MLQMRSDSASGVTFPLNAFLCHLFPQVSFFSSLWNHPFFTISCVTLIGLFFAGIHKRVVAPSMYPSQCWKFAVMFGVLSHSIEY